MINIIAIGGAVDIMEKSTYGTVCETEFSKYHPDIALLSINAVNYKDGFTDFRFQEVGIIQLLSQRAKKVIAVMDSSKLGKCSKMNVLSIDKVDILLMDNHVSQSLKEEYRDKGVNIE